MKFKVLCANLMAEIKDESIPSTSAAADNTYERLEKALEEIIGDKSASNVTGDSDMPKSVWEILHEKAIKDYKYLRHLVKGVEIMILAISEGEKELCLRIFKDLIDLGLDNSLFVDIKDRNDIDQRCHEVLDKLRKKLYSAEILVKAINRVDKKQTSATTPKTTEGPATQFVIDHKYKAATVEKIPLSELITIVQVKAEYGISEELLRAFQRASILPSPIADLSNRKYWIRKDVESILSRFSRIKNSI